MPSQVSLPSFTEREILLYQKLNALTAAIQAQFAAGVGSADLSWPLTAENNFDLSSFFLVNGKKIWNIVNARTYDTLQAAVTAAGAGGVVVVPPETTVVSTDGGVSLSTLGALIGFGPNSVIKRSSSTTATELMSTSSNTNLLISGVTLDGNSVASKNGLVCTSVTGLMLNNVWFKNFGGTALSVGTASSGLFLSNVYFSGGGGKHISVTKCTDVYLNNVHSSSAAGVAVDISAGDASSYTYAMIDGLYVTGSADTALKVIGSGSAGGSSPSEVCASNVVIKSVTGSNAAVILGTSAAVLQKVSFNGSSVSTATAGGVLVNANGGSVSDVVVDGPTTFGVDLDTSQYVTVHDCHFKGTCTVGIDGSDATAVGCVAHDNTFVSCTANITHGVGLVARSNAGVVDSDGLNTWLHSTSITTGLTNADRVTFTIPANTLKVGSTLIAEFWANGPGAHASTDGFLFYLNSQSMGNVQSASSTPQMYSRLVLVITANTTARRFCLNLVGTGWTVDTGSVTGLDITASQTFILRGNFGSCSGTSPVLHGTRLSVSQGVEV